MKYPHLAKTLLATTLVATTVLSSPAIAQPTVTKLADGVYSVFEGFYNSLVVVTDAGVVITDPAYSYRATVLKDEIAKLTDKPVTTVIVSHEHYDHAGGTEVFVGADIVCHETCMTIFSLDVSDVAPKNVDLTYRDQKTLTIGGRKIDLIHIGPADGIATTLVHLPGENILYSADLYSPRSFTAGHWMEDTNYLANIKALEKILALAPKHAVNVHSTDTSLQPVKENLELNNALLSLVGDAMQKAMEEKGLGGILEGMETWPNTLELPEYADWHGYEHLPAHIRRMALSIFHGG